MLCCNENVHIPGSKHSYDEKDGTTKTQQKNVTQSEKNVCAALFSIPYFMRLCAV